MIDLKTLKKNRDNPLIYFPTTRNRVPAFNDIEPRHYVPAVQYWAEKSAERIEKVIHNPESPTFENTIVALHEAEEELNYPPFMKKAV